MLRWNFEHVSFTLARATPELGLLNLCRMLQNAAGSREVVEAKKIHSAAEAGAHRDGIGCYCCRCFSRDGISTDM
jgi:hypothetical protein